MSTKFAANGHEYVLNGIVWTPAIVINAKERLENLKGHANELANQLVDTKDRATKIRIGKEQKEVLASIETLTEEMKSMPGTMYSAAGLAGMILNSLAKSIEEFKSKREAALAKLCADSAADLVYDLPRYSVELMETAAKEKVFARFFERIQEGPITLHRILEINDAIEDRIRKDLPRWFREWQQARTNPRDMLEMVEKQVQSEMVEDRWSGGICGYIYEAKHYIERDQVMFDESIDGYWSVEQDRTGRTWEIPFADAIDEKAIVDLMTDVVSREEGKRVEFNGKIDWIDLG